MKGLNMGSRAVGLLCSPSGRTFTVLLVGCCVFFALHNAFGLFRSAPTFETPGKFPRKIWQSWKVDPLRFADRDIERARTWTLKNPKHRYEVLTDDNAEDYVEQYFGPTGFNRPDIVSTYKMLSKPNTRIIQADLLRYLILYADGGIWADIDVSAIKPIDNFIPNSFREEDVDMVIGIETDEPDFMNHPKLGAKAASFCQWTFMTKPRLPVMMRLINGILIWLNHLADEQKRPISELELDFDTVLKGTGPSAFTEAILLEMSATLRRKVTWDAFHNLEESKLVAGVLTLSSEAFAAGTGHSRSGNHQGNRALVLHHFHASSWTKKHQRHKHPIYDEVEKCNWDPGCVKLWDANTAFFDSLPKEEQLKMIEIKRVKQVEEDSKMAGAQIPLVPAAGGLPPPPPPGDGKGLPAPGPDLSGLTPPDGKGLLAPGVDLSKLSPADGNALLPPGLLPPGVGLSKLPLAEVDALPPPTLPEGLTAADLPAPGLPVAGQPAHLPVAGLPAPGLPAPGLPAPGLPAPGLPVAGPPAAGLPAPGLPAPGLPVAGLPVAGLPAPGLPVAGPPAADRLAPGLPVAGNPAKGLPAAGLNAPGVDFPTLSPPSAKDKLALGLDLPGLPSADIKGAPEAKLDLPEGVIDDAKRLPVAIPEGLGPLVADDKNMLGQDADRLGLSKPPKEDDKAATLSPAQGQATEQAPKEAGGIPPAPLDGKVDDNTDVKTGEESKNGVSEDKKGEDKSKPKDDKKAPPKTDNKMHMANEHHDAPKDEPTKGDKSDQGEYKQEKKVGEAKDGKNDGEVKDVKDDKKDDMKDDKKDGKKGDKKE